MTLLRKAAFALRARRGWPMAIPAVALAMAVGCSHNRQSYRPIYASPAGVTRAPCTNCGSPAPVTTEEPGGVPAATVPSLSAPSSVESTVPPAGAAVPRSSGSVRSTVEPPPTARPGLEPSYEEFPSATMDRRGNGRTPAATKSANPSQGPPVQGPSSGSPPATSNSNTPADQLGAARSPSARRSASSARLQPFVPGSSANELFYPNKADRPWRYIVLHHSASAGGSYDQIDREHRKILGYDGCGYHFVIGNGTGSGDGQIEVAQRWNNQKPGVHCRNARSQDVDEYGIGICLVGNLDQQPPTPRQVAATRALVGYLSQRYRIAAGRISTHAHLAATPTVCPGRFFPAESLLVADQRGSRRVALR